MNLRIYYQILPRVLTNFYVSAKHGNRIRYSFFPSFKLLSSDCFCKIQFEICYPPPYTDLIRRASDDINWERAISNTNINEKVCIFTKSVLNVLNNFIPHETTLCDDKDPPWFNSRIKSLLQAKDNVFKNYRRNKTNIQLLNKLNFLKERLNCLITKSKNNYYKSMANKLNNLQRNSKFNTIMDSNW